MVNLYFTKNRCNENIYSCYIHDAMGKYTCNKILIYEDNKIYLEIKNVYKIEEKNKRPLTKFVFGEENNSVAFIKDTGCYKLIRRLNVKLDGNIFYIPTNYGRRYNKICNLYLPKKIFTITSLGKSYDYHNQFKTFFDVYQIDYGDISLIIKENFEDKKVESNTLFLENLFSFVAEIANKSYLNISDFRKTLTLEVKNDIITKMEDFIKKYKEFTPET